MSNSEAGTRVAARSGSAPAPARTRGGWAPAGTAAARRVAQGERTTAKGLRTRDELVTAARRVFERDGYSGARVADIAAEAGVAHGANSVIWALAEQVATVDPEIHRIRLRGRRQHVERVANTIRRWQDRGMADPGIDPQTTAGALVSMLSNFAYWWLAGGDSYDPEAAAATLTDIWARAVGLRRPQ